MPNTAPTSSDLPHRRLSGLRGELDRIDDALHDLLMRRTEVVAQVGALRAKGPVALRPGREAAILHRLLARNRGALDPATVVRVWREILNGSTAQQQRIRIALVDTALVPLVRAHFGPQPTVEPAATEAEALDDVARGAASVAVLRWPGSWWHALLQPRPHPVHVVARLPFWGGLGDGALMLTAASPDPSGDDRSLVALPIAEIASLAEARLHVTAPIVTIDSHALAEVAGFIEPGDTRMAALPPSAVVVGAYAVPVGDAA